VYPVRVETVEKESSEGLGARVLIDVLNNTAAL